MSGLRRAFPSFRWLADLPLAGKLGCVAATYISLILLLLWVNHLGASMLEGVRVFIEAEGAWSKAQKDMAFHIVRYAGSGDRMDHDRFVQSARETTAALRAFPSRYSDGPGGAGATPATDAGGIDRVIALSRWLDPSDPFQKAEKVWREIQSQVELLGTIGGFIDLEVGRGMAGAQGEEYLRQIAEVNDSLGSLERSFSSILSEAARRMRRRVQWVMAGAAGLFICAGAFISWLIVRQVLGTVSVLGGSARRIAAGEWDTDIDVSSNDEVGQLARAFRQMAEERKHAEERLDFLAHNDLLTGLPNRGAIAEHLRRAIAQADRRQELVGLLFIDLDRFKAVNDTLGHHAGDALLKEAAARLAAEARTNDAVGRLGGDEFVFILGGLARAEDAASVAERVQVRLSRPYFIEARDLSVGASVGVAIYPRDGKTPEALMRRADQAMYLEKRGREGHRSKKGLG